MACSWASGSLTGHCKTLAVPVQKHGVHDPHDHLTTVGDC